MRRHYKISGRGYREFLGATDSLKDFLEEIIVSINADLIEEPSVYSSNKQEGSLIGFVIMDDAYCFMDSWPAEEKSQLPKQAFNLDIYSAADIDIGEILNFIQEKFPKRGIDIQDLSKAVE